MSKQSLLLVDGDTRSLRVLEVSLRKAGFTVTPASSVSDALDKLEIHPPDLIISETTFPDGDGFELRRRVRGTPEWAEIPFVFLTASTAIENKIKGLELGVDDYLTKPIYIKEIITRINILLQKKQRTKFEERRDGRTRFAGRVLDMPVVDVIQTIEISRKSGVIQFVGERGRQAAIYFRDGKVIDAEAGALQGEDAVYRLLTWGEGEFEVIFRTVRRRDVITASSQGLLMEGMRRLDEWSRLLEQLPPLTHRFEVDVGELSGRLGEVPDDNNRILRLIDGRRTLLEVIDGSDCGDLECLQAISRLYFEDLLIDLDHGTPQRRDSKPMPAIEAEVLPTPIEEVASGPHAMAQHEATQESDVISEEPVGPLMGGFRPSSLRLIDEAVAAAQAIEPSLFDDADGPRDGTVSAVIESESGSVTKRSTNGESSRIKVSRVPDSAPVRAGNSEPGVERQSEASTESTSETRASDRGREDSGLRMIGSHGRDRAEASGEFAVIRPVPDASREPQREMVTILPRRITREVPIVDATGALVGPAGSVTSTETATMATDAAIDLGARPTKAPTPPAGVAGPAKTPTPPAGVASPAKTATPPAAVASPATSEERVAVSIAGAQGAPNDSARALGSGLIPTEGPSASGRATLLGVAPNMPMKTPDSGRVAMIPPRSFDAIPISARGTAELDALEDDIARPRARDPAPVVGRPVEPLPPPPKLTTTGSGVRRRAGPSPVVIAILVVAAILAIIAVYLRVRRAPRQGQIGTTFDAGVVATAPDARGFTITPLPEDAAVRADSSEIEMEPEHMKHDAGPSDAAVPKAVADAAPIDPNDKAQVAKQLMEQANAALQEGAFEKGLKLADDSLKLRRAARTLLVRATALQRLQRYDEALASIDQALEVYQQAMQREYPGGWEQKGQLLWSIRRYDEARAALEKFLELEPTGARANRVRKQLEQTP